MKPQETPPNSTESDTRRDARSPKLTASKCTRRHDSVRSDDIIVRHLESRKTERGDTQEPSGGQTEIQALLYTDYRLDSDRPIPKSFTTAVQVIGQLV